MLQSLPLARGRPASPIRRARSHALLTRSRDDPTVALSMRAACVADMLTFYQERIANEGFLRTATERRSVLELARAIGYELKPGRGGQRAISPSRSRMRPARPASARSPQGTPVQSVPPQGKLPQVFETSAEFIARAEWNALGRARLRPADMATST